MLQYCHKCKETKEHKYFPKNSKCINGIEKQCKLCKSLYRKQHYINNRDHAIKTSKQWESKNKDKISKNKKKYYIDNKDKIIKRQNSYQKEKYNNDIQFKLKVSLRSRLNRAIQNNQKSGSAISDLGCSIEELKKHLEDQFTEGMSWDNWGYNGWHIDHISRLADYNLEDREEFLKACHYTNLQPLWAEDNWSKG